MKQEAKTKTPAADAKGKPSALDALRNQMGLHATIGGMLEDALKSGRKMTALGLLATYGTLLPMPMQQVYAQYAGQEMQRQEAVLGSYLPQAAQQPYGLMPAPQYTPKGEKH